MKPPHPATALAVLGPLVLLIGVGMFSVPGALILGGVLLGAAGLFVVEIGGRK